MSGGGPKYETFEREPPEPESLLLESRIERIDEVIALRTRTLTVVLDRLEDTFNMAAVLRTAEGLGIQEVHVIDNPDVRFSPNLKVTQGCHKWLDVTRYKDFKTCCEGLKARGFTVLASAIREGGHSLYSLRFDKPVALVFGNERHGVSDEVLAQVDGTFWVPMRGFTQSFNISAAASACLNHAIAWRVQNQGASGDLTAEQTTELRAKFLKLSVKQRNRIYG